MTERPHLLLTIISFLLIFSTARAQEINNVRWLSKDTTTAKIDVVAYWNKGDKMKYRAYKRTKRYQNDSLTSERKEFDSIVQFEVTDSISDAYQVSYRMLENKRDTSKDPVLSSELMNLTTEDLALYYTTDENGAIKAYKNREPIEQNLDELMRFISKKAQQDLKPKNDAEKKAMAEMMEKLVNGKILFGSVYEVFVSQFHNFHGYRTGINDTLAYTESVPHPLTNTMIKYDCSLYVASIDSLNEVRFDIEKYADMNEFLKDYGLFLKKSLGDSGRKSAEQTQKEMTELDMKMEAYITAYIDLNTGWPTLIKVTKSVIAKDPKTDMTHFKDEIWTLTNDLSDQ